MAHLLEQIFRIGGNGTRGACVMYKSGVTWTAVLILFGFIIFFNQ